MLGMTHSIVALALIALVAMPSTVAAPRNDWYWHSPVNIHWDEHSRLLGMCSGLSVAHPETEAESQ